MDELLGEFIAETQETLEALSSIIVAWEADPCDRDRLDSVFRFFHTVKGSCGFLNLPRFERLSHAAEDVLSKVREGNLTPNPATISAVLSVMDRIAELCSALAAGTTPPLENDDFLIEALRHSQTPEGQAESEAEVSNPAAVADQKGKATAGPRTIRLPLSLIDQLMNGVSDMVLSRNELSRKLRDRESDPELEIAFERLSSCIADMRDTISKTRMQRVERLFMAIPRMVRDLSRDLGKNIELTLEGGDVEMDREMVEMVVDPLTHIVRNSIDHGIEMPTDRIAAGKSETGHLRLSARQSGSHILIEVVDDGRGINVDAVVRKIISTGVMTEQEVARLSEQERLDLIFSPGLSTAQQVTSISGRGVGMDVVRANVERVGGIITLTNEPGQGLTITMRVPLTLTIIPGLILRAGGQLFAIPRSSVIEILHDNNSTIDISRLGGADVATIRGVRHSMVDLETVIGLEKAVQSTPRTIMVVRSVSGMPYALAVSNVENHEELVIRPAAPIIMSSGIFAGMTLPDNGQPMLLLDAGGIAQAAQLPLDQTRRENLAANDLGSEADRGERHSALQFIELSGIERLIRLSLVERVEDVPIDAFGCIASQPYARIEGRLLPCVYSVTPEIAGQEDSITCLRIRDGLREVCYPVRTICDIFEISDDLDMAAPNGHVAGLAIVDGRQIEVVDNFALFASIPDIEITTEQSMRCVIVDGDDNWNREILMPLLAQAGYDVAIGATPTQNDIVLRMGSDKNDPPIAIDPQIPLVRLRPNSKPTGVGDNSIYRYDRAGLLQAIATVSKGRKSA
ncbi:MAG: chemotaxis protein CheA [Sphingobium sp.]